MKTRKQAWNQGRCVCETRGEERREGCGFQNAQPDRERMNSPRTPSAEVRASIQSPIAAKPTHKQSMAPWIT